MFLEFEKMFFLRDMCKMTHMHKMKLPFFHDASVLVSAGIFLAHQFGTAGVFIHFLSVKNTPYLEL